jgi:hypothetical protein
MYTRTANVATVRRPRARTRRSGDCAPAVPSQPLALCGPEVGADNAAEGTTTQGRGGGRGRGGKGSRGKGKGKGKGGRPRGGKGKGKGVRYGPY